MSKEGIIDLIIRLLTNKEFRDKAIDQLIQNRFDFLDRFDISGEELEGLEQFVQDIPEYLIKIVSKNLSTISMSAAGNFSDMFQSIMSGLGEMGGMEGLFNAFGGSARHTYHYTDDAGDDVDDDEDEDEIIITDDDSDDSDEDDTKDEAREEDS